MITLPTKPWKEGDTFTVPETGVVFTYDSEKWLASVESDLTTRPIGRQTKLPYPHGKLFWEK